MHVNTGSILLLIQKINYYKKKDRRHCLRLNHAMHAITGSDGGWAPKVRSRSRTIIRSRSCRTRYVGGWVCMVLRVCTSMYEYVCWYVCTVFGIVSRTKARSATNGVPKCDKWGTKYSAHAQYVSGFISNTTRPIWLKLAVWDLLLCLGYSASVWCMLCMHLLVSVKIIVDS